METLKNIQSLARLGKILSKIAFILSLVGVFGCVAGLLSLAFGRGTLLQIGNMALHSLIPVSSGFNLKAIAGALSGWLIICAGEAALSRFALLYFTRELTDGTPFTQRGAKELLRLGILTIAIPIGCTVAAAIVHGIVMGFFDVSADLPLESEAPVVLGVAFLIISLLCRHGAELTQGAKG